MNAPSVLRAFAGYGIELEYMIVDRHTLSVLPVADELLRRVAGSYVPEVKQGALVWTNELALHVIEINNASPAPTLAPLPAAFQAEARRINRLLEAMGARLMPTAMHPWMNPQAETRLWPHDNAAIYRAYDRIFDCNNHGWANLQSMQVNLPFADDAEFARLHAAIRLVLPILPALAASSPIADGGNSGFLDFRMEAYRTNVLRVPSLIGQVIPETSASRADYQERILAPLYRDMAPLDPEGVLRHDWLNSRGAIPRFERNAIEIRVIDAQENPQADLAIAGALVSVVKSLYDNRWASLPEQQAIGTHALERIMLSCIKSADEARIEDAQYLRLLDFPGRRCQAGELWRHLAEALPENGSGQRAALGALLAHGPLARRILRAVGPACERARLEEVYRELCDCLEQGRMFVG
jgi:gamma-glutamyl:cysteine ligase YbdK (ATP-grasp superfamily)